MKENKKFNKQKIFAILGKIGFFYLIFLGVSYFVFDRKPNILVLSEPQVQDAPRTPAKKVLASPPFENIKQGKKLKPMRKANFLAPDSTTVDWRAFKGSYTLVNFWATWCPPCVVELPSMTRLQKHYKDKGLNVIAISMDTNISQIDLKSFLIKRGIGEFASYMDERGEVQKNIRIRGLPTTYLLNPAGEVMHVFEGDANWFSPNAITFFEALLQEK